jgi:hypothetical protein
VQRLHEETPEDYWYRNQKRWKRVLHLAADYADMYGLERPNNDLFDRLHPLTLRDQFFWNTTHRRQRLGLLSNGVQDPIADAEPDHDAPTCWACICGDLRINMLSRVDIPLVLNTSAGRVNAGWALWDTFSADFRTSVRGLRGDMADRALRRLVLGDGRCGRG